jgi:hypothetical protein
MPVTNARAGSPGSRLNRVNEKEAGINEYFTSLQVPLEQEMTAPIFYEHLLFRIDTQSSSTNFNLKSKISNPHSSIPLSLNLLLQYFQILSYELGIRMIST